MAQDTDVSEGRIAQTIIMNKEEKGAFEQFVKRNEQKTLNFLHSRYSDLPDTSIQDIVQDAYIALYNNIEARKVEGPLYPYFLRICINLSLKALRKQGNHIVVGIDDTDIQQKNTISMNKVESILQVCEEEEVVIKEKKQFVHDALSQMATRCRELLWSYYADELSWATIATMSGLKNADTAKSQASRCRQTFKEKFKYLWAQFYDK